MNSKTWKIYQDSHTFKADGFGDLQTVFILPTLHDTISESKQKYWLFSNVLKHQISTSDFSYFIIYYYYKCKIFLIIPKSIIPCY